MKEKDIWVISANHLLTKNHEEICNFCQNSKFDGIEASAKIIENKKLSNLKQIRKIYEKNKISIKTFHMPASYFLGHQNNQIYDIASFYEVFRKKACARIKEWMKIASYLGAKTGIFHPTGTWELGMESESGKKYVKALYNSIVELLPLAKNLDFKLAFENMHSGVFGSSYKHFIQLEKKISHPNLTYCIDFGHANTVSKDESLNLLLNLKSKTTTFHVHDNFSDNDDHLFPGEGNIKWSEISNALASINSPKVFCIESFFTKGKENIQIENYKNLLK